MLNSNDAELYLFIYYKTPYPTIVSSIEDKDWLVMISLDGVIETAFPPDNLESYLTDPAFVYVGLLEGLQK